jgi:opacity protein-like surface antigen
MMLKRCLLLAATTLALTATEDIPGFELSLRQARAGATVRDFGGAWAGTGGSFAIVRGDDFVRGRLRLDVDQFAGRGGKGPVRNLGLGADGVIVVPTTSRIHPFLSIGGAVQNWSWDQAGNPAGDGKSKSWRFGVRAEAGVYFGPHFNVHVGVMRGSIVPDRLVKCPYAGVTFAF